MKITSNTNVRFQGNFKEKRRASPRRVLAYGAGIAGVAGLLYFFFFSPVFAITAIRLEGFDRIDNDDVLSSTWRIIDLPRWRIPSYRNGILFDKDNGERGLAKRYSSLKEIKITKIDRHTLRLSGVERMPIGIWCAKESCSYFDEEGVQWGQALSSSGALLTVIENQSDDAVTAQSFVRTAQLISEKLPEIGIAMKKIIIPGDAPAEFDVQTGNYIIKFASDRDIEHQLQTLRIFLEDKKRDPNFQPLEYLDLRIPDRVYFK